MSYLVLARKFRPQTFHSILGQEHSTRALATAIIREKVPHALLFTGPRGVGKTSAARVFARAVNCTGRSTAEFSKVSEDRARELVEPCGECVNCREIARSASVAVWEIDGASNNSVDNVRELIESLRSLPPPGSQYKIYIIDEVHMLSTAAFNALLKSLEEPPPNTIFIFATTEPHKIPETVTSRCQRHDFRMLNRKTISHCLHEIAQAEGVKIEEPVFDFLAYRAEGGMRDAQSMLDRLLSFSSDTITLPFAQQVFGVLDRSFFFNLAQHILEQDAASCFSLLDQAFSQSLNIRAFISDFITHFRNLLVLSVVMQQKAPPKESLLKKMFEMTEEELLQLQAQAERSSIFDMQRLFDISEQTGERAITSNFPRFVLEAGVSKMAVLPSLRPIAEIVAELRGGGAVKGEARAPLRAAPALPAAASSLPLAKQVEAVRTADFNPSWEAFVHHVQSRSEMVLATFLRRVSPLHFSRGSLQIKANPFDIATLKDSHTIQTLKTCLYSYSAHQDWEIKFNEEEGEQGLLFETPAVVSVKEKKPRKSTARPVEGSLVAKQEKEEKDRENQITEEARNDPLVQAALATFEGSSIEKVSVLKN